MNLTAEFSFLFRSGIHLGSILLILALCSCKKTDLSPITGIYVGESRVEKWNFEEILDNDGNMIGIRETRDTTFHQADTLHVIQLGNSEQFSISGSHNIARINGISDHAFGYSGQSEFRLIEESNGVISKEINFSLDGAGNVSLSYFDENMPAANRPPVGNSISFNGERQ